MNPQNRDYKWVYGFAESTGAMKTLLGGKGAGVAEMTLAGLPVPPGFTITAEACNAYYSNDRQFAEGMWTQTNLALAAVEAQTGKRFGDPANPLLVSVRSGAAISMPGLMDTVLNLGLNDQTVEPKLGDDFQTLMTWADQRRKLRVRANAATGASAPVAALAPKGSASVAPSICFLAKKG